MGYSKIEIKSKGEAPSCFTEVFIDGHKIKGCQSVTYHVDCESKVPCVDLRLAALDLAIDAEFVQLRESLFGDIKEIVFDEFSVKNPE